MTMAVGKQANLGLDLTIKKTRTLEFLEEMERLASGFELVVSHLDSFEWPTPDEAAVDVSTPERLQALIHQLQEVPPNAAKPSVAAGCCAP